MQSAHAWFNLGEMGGFELSKAVAFNDTACFQKCVSLNPNHEQAWTQLGHAGGVWQGHKYISPMECYAKAKQARDREQQCGSNAVGLAGRKPADGDSYKQMDLLVGLSFGTGLAFTILHFSYSAWSAAREPLLTA
eukprot:gnl/TRDRNA2_/TRDRNA2_172114_c1_seq1.p1 gnl/TRDRNA2_/TRDRNA2_172114_c1~~gnl/TRDRNA2_/TRDRNA2_172114_c1_seq1.p1  ORF type:complete len:135 (+),score=19.22 gnl/TRDRNA2_/TRDRNA2_172114_c1_seq1:228-632(+)